MQDAIVVIFPFQHVFNFHTVIFKRLEEKRKVSEKLRPVARSGNSGVLRDIYKKGGGNWQGYLNLSCYLHRPPVVNTR